MTVDTNTMISITEANQNFSKVTKLVDEHGTAVILKNNTPKYLVIDFPAERSDVHRIAPPLSYKMFSYIFKVVCPTDPGKY